MKARDIILHVCLLTTGLIYVLHRKFVLETGQNVLRTM